MITTSLRNLTAYSLRSSLQKSTPSRNIFSFFRRGRETEVHKTITIDKAKGKDSGEQSLTTQEDKKAQEDLELIRKRDQYFIEIRAEREIYEKERDDNKKNIDYANLRSRREFEVTVNNLDYSKILIQNVDLFPTGGFDSFDQMLHHLKDITNNTSYTEENIRHVLQGFVVYSDAMLNKGDIVLKEYWAFQDILRNSISFFNDKETFLCLVEFLDVFCVNYPELWMKIDSRVLEFAEQMETEELVNTIAHISNQGEGSERVYDQLERIFTKKIDELDAKSTTMILTGYYNTKHGTEDFFELLIKRIRLNLLEEDFSDIEVIVRISLILNDTQKELLNYVADIYAVMEQRLLSNMDKLSVENACLIAHGFGIDRGSKQLFQALEEVAFKDIDKQELTDFKGIMYGFLYNYRISEENVAFVLSKVKAIANQLKPMEIAKLYRAMYILEHERLPLYKQLEDLTLGGLRQAGSELSAEELYEIALSFNMSRTASREFFKIQEFILRARMPEIGQNKHMARKLFEIYTRSALCSPSFIKEIEFYC